MTTRNQEKSQLKSLIKDTLHELLVDDSFMDKLAKTIADKLQEKLVKLEETVKSLDFKTAVLERNIDFLQQNEKRDNICIYGINESSNENTKSVVIQTLNTCPSVNITEAELMKCYRIGSDSSRNPRPVIVKCKDFNQKMVLLKSFRDKEKHVFITEDLTPYRRRLLQEAKEKLGSKSAWSYGGIIYAKFENRKMKILCSQDIINNS